MARSTTPEQLWSALTEPEFQSQYWFGCHCDSEWTVGSSWTLVRPDGGVFDTGEIVEAEPPRRLVIRWQHQDRPEFKAEGDSLCTMEIEVIGPTSSFSSRTASTAGWPKVISNLKSLQEP